MQWIAWVCVIINLLVVVTLSIWSGRHDTPKGLKEK